MALQEISRVTLTFMNVPELSCYRAGSENWLHDCRDKIILKSSHLHNGVSYAGKRQFILKGPQLQNRM